MDINNINDENKKQQNDLKAMIIELKNKYELLENNQKKNEKIIIKSKDLILNLNINLAILKESLNKFKYQCEESIKVLKEKINKISKDNNNDKTKNEIIEQINNFENKSGEMNKKIEKRKEKLENEIKNINENIINNYIDNLNINDNNKEEKNNNNIELKINKDEEITIFQKFENLLAIIIDKNDINDEIKKELNQASEKLMINNITPHEYAAKYLSEANKYLKTEIEDKEKISKILTINKKIFSTLEELEKELKPKIEKMIEEKKQNKLNKKVDKKIQQFREKFSLTEEDATDEKIKKYLSLYNNDESKACKAIMDSILNEKYKSNKNK